MSNLTNIVFANTDLLTDGKDETHEHGNYVHIRIQQRNGRKSLTTVQGLASDLDLKKILKVRVWPAVSTLRSCADDPARCRR